jgi:hypothetical protein
MARRERLPHRAKWLELRGLVLDGWRFAEAMRDGKKAGGRPAAVQTASGSGGGTTAEPSPRGHRDDAEGSSSRASSGSSKKSKEKRSRGKKDSRDQSPDAGIGGEIAAPLLASEPPDREWQPTRSVLQQGARETGVKVGDHTPGQGLRDLR